jgi:HD-GYP domain-containing protein (c-di-GMP phosphodiesterase class II)
VSIRIKLPAETYSIIRPITGFLVAAAAATAASAIFGWHLASMLLAGMILLTGALLLVEVNRRICALRRHHDEIRQSARGAELHYVGVLRRIIEFVEARDVYTRGRSDRIGRLTERIAQKLGMPAEKCELLKIAGNLHDIGLIAVPEGVLNKGSRIGVDDFRVIQKHSEISYEVLKPLESLSSVLPGVRHHHERMNGTGYPESLSGSNIPMEARILAVADAYDAMTHDRPHRPAMSPLQAMRELRRCCPAGYDETVVNALADIMHLNELENVARNAAEEAKDAAMVRGSVEA